jgi:hypothetical protein
MLDFIARLLGGIPNCSDGPRSGDPLAIEEDYYRFQRAGESREWRPTAVVRRRAPDSAPAAERSPSPSASARHSQRAVLLTDSKEGGLLSACLALNRPTWAQTRYQAGGLTRLRQICAEKPGDLGHLGW